MDLGLQKGSGSAPPTHCTRQMLHHSVTGSAEPDKKNAAGAAWSEDDELWKRSLKLARTENSGHNPVFSTEGHQMLSFSGPEKLTSSFPYFYNTSASVYNRSFTGNHGCGAAAAEIFNDVRGPFTHSQWMELEHQALIYKHITSNIPVPSTLLMPIRRALSHAAFSHYSAGHVTPMGWDGFQLGLPSSNDPEPGRCRRTDGKKWRCSRDAVADHKYCERHINRGRHRSRKPVEGHLAPVPISPAAVGGTGCGTFGPSESPDSSRVFMSKHFTSSYGQSPAWEFRSAPMGLGGPLGEALQNSSGTTTTTTNTSSGLNLMTYGWDKNPKLTSSPTGVLQKEAAFASRTTSSSGTNAAAATY